jgi:hypothetical protein
MKDQVVSSHYYYPAHQTRRSNKKTKNSNKSIASNLLDGRNDKRIEYQNKSKEILTLKLTSSNDSIELQMERLQKQHHQQHQRRHHKIQSRRSSTRNSGRSSSSSSSIIVEQRPDSIHNHLCSSKNEKLLLIKERKLLRKERNKRKRKRFLYELKANIMIIMR